MFKIRFYFFILILMVLSSCAMGGTAETGTGEGGKISVPVTVIKQEGPKLGWTCYTQAGACRMNQGWPLNGPCTCVFPGYGQFPGQVGN